MLFSTKQPLRQSKVLTVDQILWMHCMLDSADTDAVDKSIFAYLLTALYGRCRHSDLANIESIHEDWDCNGGFLEIRTRTHKTGKSAASKTVLLPIVIPAVGVHGKPWIGKAKEAFSAVGLTYSGTIGGPLYRPPSKQLESGVCVRGITSAEVTKFLRLCFEEERPSVDACRVSSHSLKATTLTWAGKACLGPADQAILGRHSSAFTETSAVYSRDNAIRAVSELQKVIHAIHAKHFLPDCERSRYFPVTRPASEAGESGLATKTEEDSWSLIGKSEVPTSQVVIDLEGGVVDSSDTDSSSDESALDSDGSERPAPRCFMHSLSQKTAAHFVRHKVSKLVHFRDSDETGTCRTLSCGRTLNDNYEGAQRFDDVDMCRRCRLNAERDGILKTG